MTNRPSDAGRRPAQGRTVSLSSRSDVLYRGLRVPFVAPAELVELGEFVITDFAKRRNRRFNRDECAFTLTLIEGPEPNERLLTLEANGYRERVGSIFRSLAPGQVLGPLVLMKADTSDGAFYYVFGELDAEGVAHAIEDPTAGADTDPTDTEQTPST